MVRRHTVSEWVDDRGHATPALKGLIARTDAGSLREGVMHACPECPINDVNPYCRVGHGTDGLLTALELEVYLSKLNKGELPPL
jgi:hypothetical protein